MNKYFNCKKISTKKLKLYKSDCLNKHKEITRKQWNRKTTFIVFDVVKKKIVSL